MTFDFDGGHYRLQQRLSMESDSWLAENVDDPGRKVMVEVLPPGSDVIAARDLVESLAGFRDSRLSVPVDEGRLPDGTRYLVFPYREGETLRELLNTTGPLPFRRTAAILVQIGSALADLHSRSLVHGGISPDRVLAHQAHGHDAVTILGTGMFRVTSEMATSPAYMAPEQLAGEPSPLSDVFSVAAVAAEMLTGRRAFRYGSLDELHHLHRRGIQRGAFRKLRNKLPLRVEDELRRGLACNPVQRPPDIQVFTSRLAESLGANSGLPRRRLALLGMLGIAAIATGMRNCRKR